MRDIKGYEDKIAAEAINRHQSSISACLRGKQKTAGGYHWEVI